MNIYEKVQTAKDEELFDLVLSDSDIELDGVWGIIEKYKKEYPSLEKLWSSHNPGETIKKIDNEIPGKCILFIAATNGTDSLAFKLLDIAEHEKNKKRYGISYASNYVPVLELPNLWNTSGYEIDQSIEKYAQKNVTPIVYTLNWALSGINLLNNLLLQHFWLFCISVFCLLVIFILLN